MGRYLAILLARAGADVVICDVNTETLGETEKLLQRYNVAVSSIPLDMADKAAVEALPEQVIARHGKVDLLFNNAGVTVGSDFETMPEADWDWVMNINLNGVVNATRAFLPYLKQQPEAVLVNTSSIFGMIAVAKQSVYHTTKFAVRGFTEGLVREFKGSNLSVHCVHPGHIGTNIIKNSRFTETDDAESPRHQWQSNRNERFVPEQRHAPQSGRPNHFRWRNPAAQQNFYRVGCKTHGPRPTHLTHAL